MDMFVSLNKRHLKIAAILIGIFLAVFVNASMNPPQKIGVLESDDTPWFPWIDEKPLLSGRFFHSTYYCFFRSFPGSSEAGLSFLLASFSFGKREVTIW